MKQQNNPLMCDPETGVCEIPTNETNSDESSLITAGKKPVKVIYFTDPICSACWGIEPQLRQLKLEYGDSVEVDYRMGGMLKDWSYNNGEISKPSDVAHHWDEVSAYYDMPIDGDVWLEDPLDSSFPASIAFKAAQMQNNEKAILYLREVREMVFVKKMNIAKWENLVQAAKNVGLDVEKFKADYEGQAKVLFEEDLKMARQFGVRGFPTLFFTDASGRTELVYGSKPYSAFEQTLLKLLSTATKQSYDKSWSSIFSKYNSLTAKEFSVLSGVSRNESENLLNELTRKQNLKKVTSKYGALWTLQKAVR
ncbi:MAG: DsbA family protein [Paludibacter sp.]|nr:DsbA family protein [Paludibacter sp.]